MYGKRKKYLRFISKKNEDELSINRGGCGIAAILIADKINANKFYLHNSWSGRIYSKTDVPSHIYVYDKKKKCIIDTSGSRQINNLFGGFFKENVVSKKDILKMINCGCWNNDYYRGNTKRIAKMLKVKIPKDLEMVL